MNPLAGSTSSSESMEWAKYRLRRCIKSHPGYKARGNTRVLHPTRLINVRKIYEHGDVVLEIAAALPSDTEYVALSHCWGKRPILCCTTKYNYSTYTTQGIWWNKLPQSFKDAVTVTRSLGLDFLCIDSM